MKKLIFGFALLFLAIPCQARIITVDDDGSAEFDNIQAAINDSNDGDIVLVADGTYTGPGNRDIDFGGRAITVRSENGPENCIIDCQGTKDDPHRGFYFHTGEGLDSVVAGLTITNGYALTEQLNQYQHPSGGAIFCDSSSPAIYNCIIKGNRSATYGGGIGCYKYSDPTISNCVLADNSGGSGSAVNCYEHCGPTIRNCMITNNYANYRGAISTNRSCFPIISHCTIAGNTANDGHGGLYTGWASGSCYVISDCILWGNTKPELDENPTVSYSDVEGGYPGHANIDANPLFISPVAGDYHLPFNSPCINAGDPSYVPSPGETDIDGEPRVIDGRIDMGADELNNQLPFIGISLIEFNFEAFEGGSNPGPQILSIYNGGIGTLNWEIVEDCPWLAVDPNKGQSTGEIDEVTFRVDIAGLVWGKYSCELTVSDPCAGNSPQTIEVNLIVVGPVISLSATEFEFFAEAGGANPNDQILTISNMGGGTLNWEISHAQSWLDVDPNNGSSRGQPNEVTLSVDVSGMARGSYNCELIISDPNAENSPQIVPVTLSIYGQGELQVPSQYGTIQAAVGVALDGNTISVADGIYAGPGNRDIDFKGKVVMLESLGGPENCIIDCNGTEADPHRGFYFHSGEGPNSIVSGFTVKNGYVYDANGGAIYCSGSSPTIENCIIIDNKSQGKHGEWWSSDPLGHVGKSSYGGAIYCTSNSNPTIINCTISNNQAVGGDGVGSEFIPTVGKGGDGYGGGICCTLNSSPTIVGCTISNNRASGGDGADGSLGWDPGPGGGAYGGGIYCDSNSIATIDNCDFTYNKASAGNGGYDIWGYGGNGGEGSGGGICCDTDSRASINNCTISSNEVIGGQAGTGGTLGGSGGNASGSGIYLGTASTAIIKNCLMTGNQGTGGAGGNGGGITLEGMGGAGGSGRGGGICCDDNSQSIIENCSIYNNTTLGGDGGLGDTYGGDGGDGCGGGIFAGSTSESAIENCAITGNTASGGNGGLGQGSGGAGGDGYGGGIFAGSTSESTIENCTIAGNTVSGGNGGPGNVPYGSGGDGGDGYGGGIFAGSTSESTIENCTIAGNTASGGSGGSGGTNGSNGNDYGAGVSYGTANTATITNSIIWSNDGDMIYDGEPNVTYSDVKGSWLGEGNIDTDPCFADPCNGDYHLQSAAGRWDPNSQNWVQDDVNSPCIDAGDPNSDWTEELWPHGERINMGAYGGTPQASMSLSDEGNIADLNNDDSVDYKDLMLFAEDWLCEQVLLSEDLDRDGVVDFIDFAILAENWLW